MNQSSVTNWLWDIPQSRNKAYLFSAIIFLTVFTIGSEINMTEQEAQMLVGEFESQFIGIGWEDIFLHNLGLSFGMFVPFIGFIWAPTTALMTGIAFSAYTIISPDVINFSPLWLFVTPFGMMELAAYSIAMGSSIQLTAAIVNMRKTKQVPVMKIFVKTLLIRLSIITILLLIGGFIEYEILENMEEIMGVFQ